MANRHEKLTQVLRALQLRQMADRCAVLALRAAREGLNHEAFLYELAQQELAARQQRRQERLLLPRLLREKTFAHLDQTRFGPLLLQQLDRLRRGSFVREAINVIAVGRPEAGKSHMTVALGHVLVE